MESNHNKKFDQQVRKKFEDFSAEVSTSLWVAIEKEIEPEEVKAAKVFSLKRYRFISAAAALIIIGFTIWKIQPEEKIFLSGEGTVEEAALVQEPEVSQPTADRLTSVVTEEDREPVSKHVPEPVSATVVKEDGEDLHVQAPQLAVERKIEEVPYTEPVLAVKAPIESDNALLIDDASIAASSNKALDVKNENSDSLNQSLALAETESVERPKIVSGILNFVAANLQLGGDKRVEFTENEHGIIKIGLKDIFAKNDR